MSDKLELFLISFVSFFLFAFVVPAVAQSPVFSVTVQPVTVQPALVQPVAVNSAQIRPYGVYENSFRYDFGIVSGNSYNIIPPFDIAGVSFPGLTVAFTVYGLNLVLFNFQIPFIQLLSGLAAFSLYRVLSR